MIAEMWRDGWFGRAIVIALVVVLLLLVATTYNFIHNEMNRLDSGRVIDMHVSPAYFAWTPVGKTSIMIYHPERYSIVITDGVKKHTTSVSKEQYSGLSIGMQYSKTEDD